ncbi:hypothetical protein AB669_19675 [Pedobacter sp. BMA]|nr:hypothetical protein AB669_19675 [Pedobacter sp. BMA]
MMLTLLAACLAACSNLRKDSINGIQLIMADLSIGKLDLKGGRFCNLKGINVPLLAYKNLRFAYKCRGRSH